MPSPHRPFHPVALTFAAAMSLAQGARADDELATCATRSARSANEILVPSGDPQAPLGVTIDAGETLCLAGSFDPDGKFLPHLADPTRGEATVVLVVLRVAHSGTVLGVRSALGDRLAYRAMHFLGPQELGHSIESTAGRWSGDLVQIGPGPSPKRWFVYSFEVRRPPAPVRPPSLAQRTFDVEFEALGGVRALSLGAFEGPLHASGYASFPRVLPSAGVDGQAAFGRWRFTLWFQWAWGQAPARSGTGGIDASFIEFRLAGGYDFLRWRGFTGFVLGGIGGGTFSIDASGPGWTYLAGTAAALASPDSIMRDNWELTLQTGFQQIVPLSGKAAAMSRDGAWALFFSLNGGYSQQFSLGGWFSADSKGTVDGPPPLNLGGPWLLFGAGIGGYSVRPGGVLSL